MSWRQQIFGAATIAASAAAAGVLLAGPGQGGQAAAPKPASAATAASPHAGKLLWTADMEEGSLADWFAPADNESGDNGGGEYNSGSGDAVASREQSHSGARSAKLVLSDGRGATRLFRWKELHRRRELTISAWFYFPRAYRGAGTNIFQLKSTTARRSSNDPFWILATRSDERRRMTLDLAWWHRRLEGPRRGQVGFRRFRRGLAHVPVRQWFKLRVQVRQSNGFDGALRVWRDNQLLFAASRVRTGYRNCEFNRWCVDQGVSLNNYSAGLFPAPAAIYVDDVRIRAGGA